MSSRTHHKRATLTSGTLEAAINAADSGLHAVVARDGHRPAAQVRGVVGAAHDARDQGAPLRDVREVQHGDAAAGRPTFRNILLVGVKAHR